MADAIRAGIIGTGFGAVTLAPAMVAAPNVELVAFASARLSRAAEAADRFGAEHVFDDYRDLVALDGLDLVCVCTPPELHVEMTTTALDLGRHVFCPKPLAPTTGEARRLLEHARSRGAVHAMDLGRRYVAARRYFGELVDQGFLGELRFVSSTTFEALATDPTKNGYYFNWIARRPHGGMVHAGLMNHYVDLVRFLFGEIYDARGRATTLIREKPVLDTRHESPYGLGPWVETHGTEAVDAEDAAVIDARFANGALVSVVCTWSVHHGTGERLEAYGSNGTLVLQGTDRLLGAAAGDAVLAEMPIPERFAPPPIEPYTALYSCLVSDMAGVILGTHDQGMFATFDDGVRLLEIGDAVLGPMR